MRCRISRRKDVATRSEDISPAATSSGMCVSAAFPPPSWSRPACSPFSAAQRVVVQQVALSAFGFVQPNGPGVASVRLDPRRQDAL